MDGIILAGIVVLLLISALFVVGNTNNKKARQDIYDKLYKYKSLNIADSSARKDCLIGMDALLGKSLAYAGVKGATLGERLKNAKNFFERKLYNDIWEYHKLRNRVVHENEDITAGQADSAKRVFEAAIKRLLK